MTTDIVERLKADWFQRFEQILDNSKTIPLSGLKCIDLCEARCCPRVGLRAMPPNEVASPIVVLLPFEMEYLIKKTGVSRNVFRRWPLDLTPETAIQIGMLDLGKPCPFLSEKLQCKIHEHNPLDCRTFPLLPFQDLRGNLDWELGANCPSVEFLNPTFVTVVKRVWAELYSMIPQGWWDIYAFADHWTGWPQPEEMIRGD